MKPTCPRWEALVVRKLSRVSVYKGRYHRTLGRFLDRSGKLRPRKFLMGTDAAAAEIANRLL